MQDLLGTAEPAGWLQLAASLLHMIPANLLVGGALMAAVLSFSREPEAVRLFRWLGRLLPAAAVGTVVLGLLSFTVLNGLTVDTTDGAAAPELAIPVAGTEPDRGAASELAEPVSVTKPGGSAAVSPTEPIAGATSSEPDMPVAVTESKGTGMAAAGRPPSGLSGPSLEDAGPAGRYKGVWPVFTLALLALGGAAASFLSARRSSGSWGRIGALLGASLMIIAVALCVEARNIDEQRLLFETTDVGPTVFQPLDHLDLLSVVPRFLHILLACIAVTGLAVAVHGLSASRADERYGRWVMKVGVRWFAVPTSIQLAVGFWLLIALPGPVRARYLGGSPAATAELMVGILLAVAVLVVVSQAGSARNPAPLLWTGIALLGMVLLTMALLREQAAHAALHELGAGRTLRALSGMEWTLAAAVLAVAGGLLATWLHRAFRAVPPPTPRV